MDSTTKKLLIICPECEARYRVPESITPRKVHCKRCGGEMIVAASQTASLRPTTSRVSRMKGRGRRSGKLDAFHYLSAAVTIAMVAVIIKVMAF